MVIGLEPFLNQFEHGVLFGDRNHYLLPYGKGALFQFLEQQSGKEVSYCLYIDWDGVYFGLDCEFGNRLADEAEPGLADFRGHKAYPNTAVELFHLDFDFSGHAETHEFVLCFEIDQKFALEGDAEISQKLKRLRMQFPYP